MNSNTAVIAFVLQVGGEGEVSPCGRAKVPAYPLYGCSAPVTPPPGGSKPPGPPVEQAALLGGRPVPL